MNKYIIGLFIACSAFTASAEDSILSLKHSLKDSKIVAPTSFETDVRDLEENWYLENYTVLVEQNKSARTSNTATDAEYIERLSKLPTTIEMPFNSVVKAYIEMYIRKEKLVEKMLGMSLYYMPIFEQALEAEGMPNELKYVPVIESALNPFAKSRAKAVGLWQFMSPTARGLGLEINSLVDERRDPIRSSTMGARYLKQLYEIYKDWSLAIAAYNCGPGNVNKALRRCQSDRKDFWAIYNYLPAETRGYVPAFIAANYIMTYYNMHGISPSLAKRPLVTDTVHVSRRVHFKQIAEVLDIPEKEIRILNPQYLQDVIPGDIHPYALILPSHQVLSYVVSEDSILKFDAEKYGRRTEVEPGEEFNDGEGEYVNKLVVKYHNVRKGESLGKIANKYGCTINNLKKWNNLRNNNIRVGQRLKIQSYQRVRVPKKEDPELKAAVAEKASADSIAATKQTDSVQTVTTQPAKAAEQVKKPTTPKKPQKQYVTHKIKSGENLGAIARKYGVTVQQIKRANPNIKGTRINAGQRIKIPVK